MLYYRVPFIIVAYLLASNCLARTLKHNEEKKTEVHLISTDTPTELRISEGKVCLPMITRSLNPCASIKEPLTFKTENKLDRGIYFRMCSDNPSISTQTLLDGLPKFNTTASDLKKNWHIVDLINDFFIDKTANGKTTK